MLNSPEHYLRPKTVTKQEVSTSYEVIDNALNVRSQLLITPNENRLSVATTMPSQIKCNRAKTCFRERPSDVNIASRVFAKTVNNQHVCRHTGFRIPPAVEKRQAVNGRTGASTLRVTVEKDLVVSRVQAQCLNPSLHAKRRKMSNARGQACRDRQSRALVNSLQSAKILLSQSSGPGQALQPIRGLRPIPQC